MNKIEETIKKVFLMSNGTLMPITLENLTSYLAKNNTSCSVAIPFTHKKQIFEEFVGMDVSTSYANFDDESIPVLVLKAPNTVDIDKFIMIAADFIRFENRESLNNDPYDWIDKWRKIFGDSIKKKMVYDVIGEMLALKTFYSTDKTLEWIGQENCTHDIVGKDFIYEVKSTLIKTENIVYIHSSYQLSTNKNTNLVFVRLEKKPHSSLSINSLLKDLIAMGYNQTYLEESLQKNGFKEGNRNREETYDLLSLYVYKVNKLNFPIISLQDINSNAPLKNILGFELKIDLTPIEPKILFEKK